MPRLCSYVLSNGNRCRCAANQGDEYCRHHNLDGLRHRQPNPDSTHVPAANPSDEDEFRPHLEWAHLRRFIVQEANLEDCQGIVETLMHATSEGQMAERTAGRLLVLLYHRREQLLNEVAAQQIQALQNELAKRPELAGRLIEAGQNPQRRASSQVIAFQSTDSTGSNSKIPTQGESIR